jgi:hypothetical protein
VEPAITHSTEDKLRERRESREKWRGYKGALGKRLELTLGV